MLKCWSQSWPLTIGLRDKGAKCGTFVFERHPQWQTAYYGARCVGPTKDKGPYR